MYLTARANLTSNDAAADCDACPVGTFLAGTGATCKGCVSGSYQDETGQTECKTCTSACDAGEYFTAQADATVDGTCTDCVAGQFKVGTSAVTQCATWYQCPKGEGKLTNGSKVVDVTCENCTKGQFSDAISYDTCKECAIGYYADAVKSSNCTQCAEGTATNSPKTIICAECIAGKYQLDKGQTSCIACEHGRFATDERRTTACTHCVSGQYQMNNASISCALCFVGKYHGDQEEEAYEESHCDSCPAGKFQHQEGSTSCYECPSGKFSDQQTPATCTACEVIDDLRYYWTENKANAIACVPHPLPCKMNTTWGAYSQCTLSCRQKAPSQTCCTDDHAVCLACSAETSVPLYCKDYPTTTGCEQFPDSTSSYTDPPTPAPVVSWGPFGDHHRFTEPEYRAWGGGTMCKDLHLSETDDQIYVAWRTALSSWEQSETCNPHACPIDCVVGEWTQAQTCLNATGATAKCGGGTSLQIRHVHTPQEYGGKACPSLEKSTACNSHKCRDATCHTNHVRCKVEFSAYGPRGGGDLGAPCHTSVSTAASGRTCYECDDAVECAAKHLVRTISVTHDRNYQHVSSQFHCHLMGHQRASAAHAAEMIADAGAGYDGRHGAHVHTSTGCVCHCTKHPLACFKKNQVINLPTIHGNYYFGVPDMTACSNMCSHHPHCDGWEYDSSQRCLLKEGTVSFSANQNTEITTWSGLTTQGNGCLDTKGPGVNKYCPINQYRTIDPVTISSRALSALQASLAPRTA